MCQGSFKVVYRKFQGCFKEDSQVLQGTLKDVYRKLQGYFKEVSQVFQGNLKGASRVFERSVKLCVKEVSMVL